MKTDEAIEQERQALEPLIGPTRAGWYAEACDVHPEKDGHDVTLWACRYREMAMEAGRLEAIKTSLLAACEAVAKALDYRNASSNPADPNYANPAIVAADRTIAEQLCRAAIAKATGKGT